MPSRKCRAKASRSLSNDRNPGAPVAAGSRANISPEEEAAVQAALTRTRKLQADNDRQLSEGERYEVTFENIGTDAAYLAGLAYDLETGVWRDQWDPVAIAKMLHSIALAIKEGGS